MQDEILWKKIQPFAYSNPDGGGFLKRNNQMF